MKKLLFACGLVVSSAMAQSTPYQLRVDSRLVQITLTVRDSSGNLVTSLPQTAFHLREDGIPQTIRYFATERQLPLSIGLLIDASGSQDKFVKEHEKEIESFLANVMEPRDHAFAVCFGNHLRLCSDWSADPHAILDGVHRFHKGDRKSPEIGPQEDRALGTALNDAVWFSIADKMKEETGRRKVLVIFSDGEENSSEHDESDAIAQAQSADTLVYALRTTENKPSKETARDRYGMRLLNHLTESTGGRSFDVREQKPAAIFTSMAADLRSLYELGYYSTNTEHDGTFRKVVITVDGEGLKPRARSGYIAPSH